MQTYGLFDYTVWDIHPDNKRFLMMKPLELVSEASTASKPREKIIYVLNWTEELKKKVP
jgi:hypothetical protein